MPIPVTAYLYPDQCPNHPPASGGIVMLCIPSKPSSASGKEKHCSQETISNQAGDGDNHRWKKRSLKCPVLHSALSIWQIIPVSVSHKIYTHITNQKHSMNKVPVPGEDKKKKKQTPQVWYAVWEEPAAVQKTSMSSQHSSLWIIPWKGKSLSKLQVLQTAGFSTAPVS